MSKIVSKTKQRKAGVILQYLQMALNIVISLIYTPVMLRILGKTEYGIYNLSSSIIAYLSLISLGFGASYIRFYSIYSKDVQNKYQHLPYGWLYLHEPCKFHLIVYQHDTM